MIYDVLLFNGYQEILIFSIFTLFSKYFYFIIKNNIYKNFVNFYYIIILLLFLNVIWIKNEAIFFSFISMLLILCLPKKNHLFRLSVFFSFFIIIILRFFIFKKIGLDISTIQTGNFENLNLLNLGNYFMFDKMLLIFKYFFFGLVANLVYIISICAMLFMFYYSKNKTELSFYFASLILNFLLIFIFYIFTTTPIDWSLKTTIERVMFEVLGIYLIPIVIFINIFSKKIFNG